MTDLHDGQQASTLESDTDAVPETAEVESAALNADQREALTFVEEICAASHLELRPIVRALHPPYIEIELVGDDAAGTFGRYGQSLDALQFLTNLILSHRLSSDIRLLLDAGRYRERRAAALREHAMEIAREVKARNEEAELEPLPAHERRIIHTALADDPDIRTYSEGDEPDRHIVISPRR